MAVDPGVRPFTRAECQKYGSDHPTDVATLVGKPQRSSRAYVAASLAARPV